MNTFTGRLTRITRLNNSINGNPKLQLHFERDGWDNQVVTTSTDSMITYKISDSLIGETLNLKYHYNKKYKAILEDFTNNLNHNWNMS